MLLHLLSIFMQPSLEFEQVGVPYASKKKAHLTALKLFLFRAMSISMRAVYLRAPPLPICRCAIMKWNIHTSAPMQIAVQDVSTSPGSARPWFEDHNSHLQTLTQMRACFTQIRSIKFKKVQILLRWTHCDKWRLLSGVVHRWVIALKWKW